MFYKEMGQRAPEVTKPRSVRPGMSNLAPKLGQICPKWDKSGTFKISFITFWLGEPKCTEIDLKSPQFVPFGADQTQFGDNPDSPAFKH